MAILSHHTSQVPKFFRNLFLIVSDRVGSPMDDAAYPTGRLRQRNDIV
ncbi:hypothetical protein [Nostoc sp.]